MPKNIEQLKIVSGIQCANCTTCYQLSSDGDGGEPEYAVNWPVCARFPTRHNLKSFPFKKEMGCWEPNFWHSKFTEVMKRGTQEEMTDALEMFQHAIEPHL